MLLFRVSTVSASGLRERRPFSACCSRMRSLASSRRARVSSRCVACWCCSSFQEFSLSTSAGVALKAGWGDMSKWRYMMAHH